MSRVGSRSNPLTAALLAGHAQGAYSLPDGMIVARDRLASLQAVVSAQRSPAAEQDARREAVAALTVDPAADVATAVLEGRQVDAEHAVRAELLREAVEYAADALDRVDVDEVLVQHLQPAYGACVGRLLSSYTVFSAVSTDQDQLWDTPKKIRDAWSEFRRAANDHEQLRTAWFAVRAGSPPLLDVEGLFAEIANLSDVWPERATGQRPVSTMTPPWPPRRDVVPWLIWALSAGAALHLPSREEQDLAWSHVFAARTAEFAGGDRHVGQMREIFAR